jgi:hypothetical protein
MITQSQAEDLIRKYEYELRQVGYEQSQKHHFSRVLDDMVRTWHTAPFINAAAVEAVRSIEKQWVKDRVDPATAAGANTIHSHIAALRKLIPLLPETLPGPRPGEAGYVREMVVNRDHFQPSR